MSVLVLVRALAEAQHGAVSRAQLLERGASRHAIAWAVDVGELLVVAPEVYVVAGSPRTWRQALMVAVLDAGPGACVGLADRAQRRGVILRWIAARARAQLFSPL